MVSRFRRFVFPDEVPSPAAPAPELAPAPESLVRRLFLGRAAGC